MSVATAPPTVNGAGDDFEDWEAELGKQPSREPARFVSKREAIDKGLGFRRYRTREQEA